MAFQPEHMQPWTRNQRLYEALKGMGLFVTPIPFKDDPEKLNWIQVSVQTPADDLADLTDRMKPSDQEGLVPRGIGSPMQGAQVADVVRPSPADGDNVVYFPPVL
ncbi:MAG: hypothetical protein OXU70_09310 [Gammaproteobacteria bacterium]|nr:hypothetical protein [Gammaproteobacteria bacterium]